MFSNLRILQLNKIVSLLAKSEIQYTIEQFQNHTEQVRAIH